MFLLYSNYTYITTCNIPSDMVKSIQYPVTLNSFSHCNVLLCPIIKEHE